MLKITNENNEILGFLESESDMPKWLIYFKGICQAELDMCKKSSTYTGKVDTVSITQSEGGFIFRGVFTEHIFFSEIEPWKGKV